MLDESLIRDYVDDGFCIVRSVVGPDQLTTIKLEVTNIFDQFQHDCQNLRVQFRRRLNQQLVVDRVDPIIDQSPELAALARGGVLEAIAADALGESARLFKDKLVWKGADTQGYELHQDFTFWSDLGPNPVEMLSVCVALDTTTAENGAMKMYPGEHSRHLHDKNVPRNMFSSGSGVIAVEQVDAAHAVLATLDPGDVVVFSSLTPHESAANKTDGLRRQLFFSYCPARYGDLYQKYYELFHSYLRRDRQDQPSAYFK